MNATTRQSALFESIGGTEACRLLSARFHAKVARDPTLGPIFPRSLDRTTEWFTLFLIEYLGGAPEYKAKRGKQSLVCRHAHLCIGSGERDAWLSLMFAAMDEVEIAEPARAYLCAYFTETAKTLTDPLLPYYGLPLNELRPILTENPALAATSDNAKTLLDEAARCWDLPRVQILLEFGADVNGTNRMGHAPLYHATNAHDSARESEGCSVVELLLEQGANVNEHSGPGRSTPLHMAARRDHVSIASALLDAGANIEATDSKGETPLRRAVNCGQDRMVLFLLSRGADPLTLDKHGRTPGESARKETIRQALSNAQQN